MRMTSSRLATQGQVLARVYRDANGDGVRQPDEPFERDVQIAAGRAPVDALTDANGEVVVDGLEAFRPVLIGVDASSLPDPMVSPSGPGMVVTPRPGIIATVELGLTGAGEVDGTLVKAGSATLEVSISNWSMHAASSSGARAATLTDISSSSACLMDNIKCVSREPRPMRRAHAGLAGDIRIDGKAPSVHLGPTTADPSDVRTASVP